MISRQKHVPKKDAKTRFILIEIQSSIHRPEYNLFLLLARESRSNFKLTEAYGLVKRRELKGLVSGP
jgi:hypothetical protein